MENTLVELLCILIFWVFFSELSYFLSKFTTIGNKDGFQDFIFKANTYLMYTANMPRLANFVLSITYSKLFVCRPCHTFWMTWIFTAWFCSWYFALYLSLLTYARIKANEKEPNKGTVN